MLWRATGTNLPELIINARDFDSAVKVARRNDERYNTFQPVEEDNKNESKTVKLNK